MRVGRPLAEVPASDSSHPSLEHPLKGGVERTFFDLQELVGNLLDVLDEAVAVHGAEPERLQDHHLESAGKEVAMFGVPGHIGRI